MGGRVSKLVGGSSVYGYKSLETTCVLGPRGYVPVCVGVDEDSRSRFMVHVQVLKDVDFCELLRKSAEEYGFQNDGILKILFEAQDFEDWIVKRHKRRKIIMRVKSRRLHLVKRSSMKQRRD